MILSKEFYDQCVPSYKKVIDELENDLADIENSNDAIAMKTQKILLTINTFSKSYLTPNEYWQHCLDLIELCKNYVPSNAFKKLCREYIQIAYFHLCCVKKWNNNINVKMSELKPYADTYLKLDYFHYFNRAWPATERDLSYPHDMLKECFRQFEKRATKLPSKKIIERYEEMVKLYPEIVAAEDDDEKWYKLLLRIGDNAYVINNVEYRLGQDLLNIKLWKMYVGFLMEHGEYKHLLGVYSKYCRLFLDDLEIKKEYEQAFNKYGPIYLPWENLFDFEVKNGMEEEEDRTQHSDSVIKKRSPFDNISCADFYETYKRQNFSLPGPLVLYILKNAGHRVLQRLFFSCKYFFAKQPTPICYSLRTGLEELYEDENYLLQTCLEEIYEDESLTFIENPKQESFPKNLYITGKLIIGGYHFPPIDFLPYLYRCEAKYIHLGRHNLSFDELKFLIGHGGVVELNLLWCNIKDENGQFIDLEKIVAFLPNIERLTLVRVKTNAKTGHTLAAQKFNSKIFKIFVHHISGVPFDVDEFMKFLTANKDDKQLFSADFLFNEAFDAAFVENLGQIMDDYSNSHQNDCISAEFDWDDDDDDW